MCEIAAAEGQRAPAPLNARMPTMCLCARAVRARTYWKKLAVFLLLHLPSGLCTFSRCRWGEWKTKTVDQTQTEGVEGWRCETPSWSERPFLDMRSPAAATCRRNMPSRGWRRGRGVLWVVVRERRVAFPPLPQKREPFFYYGLLHIITHTIITHILNRKYIINWTVNIYWGMYMKGGLTENFELLTSCILLWTAGILKR